MSKKESQMTSENSNETNDGIRFVEDERNTILGIFDILLNEKDGIETRKERCADAIEQLFKLFFMRKLSMTKKEISTHPILLAAVEKFGISAEDIVGRKRAKHIIAARRWVVLKMRKEKITYIDIGKILGDRAHTTIMILAGKR